MLIMEAANIFCGAAAGTVSNHLRLMDVKLPGWEEQYIDYRAGGAPVAIEIDLMFNKLQCDFTLAGWAPSVAGLIEAWSQQQNQFWVFGALRLRERGDVYQAEADITGRLGRATPESFSRGTLSRWSYSIRGIISYQLKVNKQLLYNWSFFDNSLQTTAISMFE